MKQFCVNLRMCTTLPQIWAPLKLKMRKYNEKSSFGQAKKSEFQSLKAILSLLCPITGRPIAITSYCVMLCHILLWCYVMLLYLTYHNMVLCYTMLCFYVISCYGVTTTTLSHYWWSKCQVEDISTLHFAQFWFIWKTLVTLSFNKSTKITQLERSQKTWKSILLVNICWWQSCLKWFFRLLYDTAPFEQLGHQSNIQCYWLREADNHHKVHNLVKCDSSELQSL